MCFFLGVVSAALVRSVLRRPCLLDTDTCVSTGIRATVLIRCLTPHTAQTDNPSRPDLGKCDKLSICRTTCGTAEELLHRRTVNMPTAPTEGRRRNLSRRYKKIGVW